MNRSPTLPYVALSYLLTLLLALMPGNLLHGDEGFSSIYRNCQTGFKDWPFDPSYERREFKGARVLRVHMINSDIYDDCQTQCAIGLKIYSGPIQMPGDDADDDKGYKGAPILIPDENIASLNSIKVKGCLSACYKGQEYVISSITKYTDNYDSRSDYPTKSTIDEQVDTVVKSSLSQALFSDLSKPANQLTKFTSIARAKDKFIIKMANPKNDNGRPTIGIIGDPLSNAIYLDGFDIFHLYPYRYSFFKYHGYGISINDQSIWAAENISPTVVGAIGPEDAITIRYGGMLARKEDKKLMNDLYIWIGPSTSHLGQQFVLNPPYLNAQYYDPRFLNSDDIDAQRLVEEDDNIKNIELKKEVRIKWQGSIFSNGTRFSSEKFDDKYMGLCQRNVSIIDIDGDKNNIPACNNKSYREDIFHADRVSDFAGNISNSSYLYAKHPINDDTWYYSDIIGGYNVRITIMRNAIRDGRYLAYKFIDASLDDDQKNTLLNDSSGWKYVFNEINDSSNGVSISIEDDNIDASYEGYFKIITPFSNIRPEIGYGGYFVNVERLASRDNQGFICKQLSNIKDVLYGKDRRSGITGEIYNILVKASAFRNAIMAILLLYIVYMGFNFLLGLSQTPQRDMVGMALKLAIIGALLSDSSWSFFYDHFFALFIQGFNGTINKFTFNFGQIVSQANLIDSHCDLEVHVLSSIRVLFDLIFSADFLSRIIALGLKITTIISAISVLIGLVLYSYGVIFIILSYINSLFVFMIIIMLAPLFICFILFKYTREAFNSVVKQLILSFISPVAMFSIFSILYVILLAIIYNTFNFAVCEYRLSIFSIKILDLPVALDAMHSSSFLGGIGARTVFGSFAILLTAYMIAIIPSFFQHIIEIIIYRAGVKNTFTAGNMIKSAKSALNKGPVGGSGRDQ